MGGPWPLDRDAERTAVAGWRKSDGSPAILAKIGRRAKAVARRNFIDRKVCFLQ